MTFCGHCQQELPDDAFYRDKRRGDRPHTPCKECKKAINSKQVRPKRTKAQYNINLVKAAARARIYYHRNPETDAVKKARRKARIRGVYHENVRPTEIFERDKWRCRLCGAKTPREKRGTSLPDAPVLDHIVPIVLGGPHSRRNLRCLCYACNASKGAKYSGQLAFA